MQVWKVLDAARWKYRTQKWRKNSPSENHCTTVSGCILARHVSTIGKKFVKQQYLLQMSSQYDEIRPTNGWHRLASLGLGHPCKCQWVARLGFVTAPTLTNGGQPTMFGPLLAGLDWLVHYIYLLRGYCHITEFFQVQNWFCVQVLRSSILAALLDGTRAVDVSRTLRRVYKEWDYGTFAPRHFRSRERKPPNGIQLENSLQMEKLKQMRLTTSLGDHNCQASYMSAL